MCNSSLIPPGGDILQALAQHQRPSDAACNMRIWRIPQYFPSDRWALNVWLLFDFICIIWMFASFELLLQSQIYSFWGGNLAVQLAVSEKPGGGARLG